MYFTEKNKAIWTMLLDWMSGQVDKIR